MAERVERRLTTILAADIAEYSRLMRADEDATMRALHACRAVIDRLVGEHRGRIANTAGDAVLAEFPSVADGLACALAIAAKGHLDPTGELLDRGVIRLLRDRRAAIEDFLAHEEAAFLALA